MNILWNCLWVAGFGAVGAVARYGVGMLFRWTTYPLGTLVINLSGAFVLGWLYTALAKPDGANDTWRLAVGVGFLGAYTTFSTFMYESDKLLSDAQWLRASSYLAASLFLGLLAVRLGVILGKAS